jgi:SAM domain (Sterile alpha motif)
MITAPLPTFIEEWLKSVKLEQYSDAFKKHNYDMLEMLEFLTEAELDLMGIIEGHNKLLAKKAQELSARIASN